MVDAGDGLDLFGLEVAALQADVERVRTSSYLRDLEVGGFLYDV